MDTHQPCPRPLNKRYLFWMQPNIFVIGVLETPIQCHLFFNMTYYDFSLIMALVCFLASEMGEYGIRTCNCYASVRSKFVEILRRLVIYASPDPNRKFNHGKSRVLKSLPVLYYFLFPHLFWSVKTFSSCPVFASIFQCHVCYSYCNDSRAEASLWTPSLTFTFSSISTGP